MTTICVELTEPSVVVCASSASTAEAANLHAAQRALVELRAALGDAPALPFGALAARWPGHLSLGDLLDVIRLECAAGRIRVRAASDDAPLCIDAGAEVTFRR